MILIFYALRRELSGLRKRISQRAPLGPGLRGFKGQIGTEGIFLMATGIGIVNCANMKRGHLDAGMDHEIRLDSFVDLSGRKC